MAGIKKQAGASRYWGPRLVCVTWCGGQAACCSCCCSPNSSSKMACTVVILSAFQALVPQNTRPVSTSPRNFGDSIFIFNFGDQFRGQYIYFVFSFGPGFCGLSGLSCIPSSRSTNSSCPSGLPVLSCFRKVFISSSDDSERKSFQLATIESSGSTLVRSSSCAARCARALLQQ